MAIKFNGVHKVPGRPTLVGGPEGRKYIASKILNNLPQTGAGNYIASRPAASQYDSQTYMLEQQECEYGMDNYGFTESLNDDERLEVQYQEQYQTEDEAGEEQERAYQESLRILETTNAFNQQQEQYKGYQQQGQQIYFEQEQSSCQQFQASHFERIDIMQADAPEAPAPRSFEEGFSVQGVLSWAASLESNQVSQEQTQQVDEEETNEHLFEDDCNYLNEQTGEMLAQKEYSRQMQSTQNEEHDCRPDGKTGLLRVPTIGVVRSSRGTVELLVHANGRTFKPRYNMCGLLTGVSISDGLELICSRSTRGWHLFDTNGNLIEQERIHTVAFDKRGNLWYQTVSGKSVTYYVDGSTVTRVA